MKLVDLPRPVEGETYARAIDLMVSAAKGKPGVIAVYQVGGIGTPGVSDIDLCVVFEDAVQCAWNPLLGLDPVMRYLYAHSLFGFSRTYFERAHHYAFFHNYRLRWGRELPWAPSPASAEDTRQIQVQTGLEYLLKMFIWLTVVRTYGILQVRNLLLLGKALLYDLEYLEVRSGPLVDLLHQLIGWRQSWFSRPASRSELVEWVSLFHEKLRSALDELLRSHPLFVPEWVDPSISSNMELVPAGHLGFEHRGLTLPAFAGGLGRRYFNLQHRFNRFRFMAPIATEGTIALRERHEFMAASLDYNRRYLPHFLGAAVGLQIFSRNDDS